jgi:hypothetical protein
MAYVEWLRVRACLKWTGLALGILLLVAVGLRIAAVGIEHNISARVAALKADPGSKVTDTVLPDGMHQITIDNRAKNVHVVIEDRGFDGKHIVLDESGRHHEDVTTGGPTPFSVYLVVGFVVALIVATVLGAPFAREADGHLETALTKPVSRELFALQTILIDWCGLLVAFFGATLLAIAVHALFDVPHITFDGVDAMVLGAGIAGPLAWYAMLNAATASLKRGYGALQGLAWPIGLIVVGLSAVEPDGNAFLTLVHDVGWTLSWIDPLRYMHFGREGVRVDPTGIAPFSYGTQLAALAVLAVVYLALAVVQWRRVEA